MLANTLTVTNADASTTDFVKCSFSSEKGTIYKAIDDSDRELRISTTTTKSGEQRTLVRVSTKEVETLVDGSTVPVYNSAQIVISQRSSAEESNVARNVNDVEQVCGLSGLLDQSYRGEM